MELLASVDGVIGPAAEATIPATDEGLLRGDGAFEVLRLYGGRPFAIDDHMTRFETSVKNLRLPADPSALRADAEALIAAAGPVDALLRILWTRGGHRLAFIEPLPEHPPSVRLGVVTYSPTRVLNNIKSLSYCANMLCTRLAKERGFDEALQVTPHGRVLEGPTSSFFWARDGKLRTPPLAEHILPSITRRLVLEGADAVEEPTTLEDLAGAEEAFLASTIREVHPVSAIEDIEIPVGGPVTTAAAARVRAAIDAALGAPAT